MSLVEDYNSAYRESSSAWDGYWKEARRDTELYLGKQWSKKDLAYLEAQDRDPEVYNRTKLIISRISGYQRKNRLAIRVEATAGSDQTAGLLSSLVQYELSNNKQYCYRLMSSAFRNGALISGINDIELYMDYSLDPVCGDIRYRRRPYNSMLRDPTFTEPDLSDCRYILDRIWVTKDQAKMILPGHSAKITSMLPKGPDGKYPQMAKEKDYRGKALLRLDRFFREDFKKTIYLQNRATGELTEWNDSTAALDRALNEDAVHRGVGLGVKWGAMLNKVVSRKRTIKVAYLLDDVEMYDGDDPLGLDDYPFVPVMGYYLPEYAELKWSLQGLVRTIRDAATQGNKRRLKLFDMLDSQLLGMAVEDKAMMDIRNINVRGHGATYFMKEGKLDRIKPLTGPPVQPGTLEMLQQMDKDQDELAGVTPELSGMIDQGENAQSFIQSKLREGNALLAFGDLFDNYRGSKGQLGYKTMRLAQVNYTPQKVSRITKKQPTEEFFKKDFGIYDCVVAEGALTDSQKKMRYGEAVALKSTNIVPIPASKILELSGLEIEPEIIQSIKQQEQIGQQLQMAKVQAEIQQINLRAALDKAKAENLESRSGLDRAKTMEAIKKIESMDHERLYKLLEIAMTIEKEGHFGTEPLAGSSQPGDQNVIPINRRQQMADVMTTR